MSNNIQSTVIFTMKDNMEWFFDGWVVDSFGFLGEGEIGMSRVEDLNKTGQSQGQSFNQKDIQSMQVLYGEAAGLSDEEKTALTEHGNGIYYRQRKATV